MTWHIDPELKAAMPEAVLTDLSDVAAARERLRELRASLPPVVVPDGVARREVVVPSREDGRAIRCLAYAPKDATSAAALPVAMVFHGGGFVMGDIEGDESLPLQIVTELGFAALAVGYRLAPEHPYPAAVDDAEDALRWLAAGQLPGVDPARIASVGASAGGCIAAGLVVRASRSGPPVRAAVLDVPVLDDRLQHPSMQLLGTPLWDRAAAELSWGYYLSGLDGDVPDDAAPARAERLADWPPTYIAVNALDPLRDEGIALAQRLTDVQVPTELHLYPGTFHGSTSTFATTAVSRRARRDLLDALGRLLG